MELVRRQHDKAVQLLLENRKKLDERSQYLSLEELYHMDFQGNYFLACTHIRKVLNKINRIQLGIKKKYPYINSGVMLMNLEELRKNKKYLEIGEYVKQHKKVLTLPDQDSVIGLYGDKIGLLDTMHYNLSDRILALYNGEAGHEKRDLNCIHYYGKQKPWKKIYLGILDVFLKKVKA